MKITDPTITAALLKIAQKHFDVETLEARHMDDLDFHDTSVWCMKAALEEAFTAGMTAGIAIGHQAAKHPTQEAPATLADTKAATRPNSKPAKLPEVSNRPYVQSHGKAPRGQGSWAFCPAWAEDRGDYHDFTRFFSGTYAEARKQAQQAFYGEKLIVALP